MTFVPVGKANGGNHSFGVGCQSLGVPCVNRLYYQVV